MNSKDRVLTTFNHKEPDRVPLFELSIESPDVANGYGIDKVSSIYSLDVENAVALYQRIGLDLSIVPICGFPIGKGAGFGKKKPGLKTPRYTNMVEEFGRVITYSIQDLPTYVGGWFDSETGDLDEIIEKYEKFPPLDPNAKLRYIPFERAVKAAETSELKSPYIIPMMQGFFENSWQPFGFENYTRLLFERPDFIEEVLRNIDVFLTELIRILFDRYSIELICYGDDLGYKTGPLINPRKFQKLIYPRMKKFVEFCHKKNMKVLFHSCGNLNKILDKVIETGIDGLHPLEPSAAMDIFATNQSYGDKLTLIGNVDTIDLLAKGTAAQVQEYVKKEIKYIAPNGGLIISSSHSINPQISFENYKAMIEATKKYGKYPILIND
ncbi:MAG: uroporphyrinogen decarboxylase family protein [Candidatus Hodarchaeota archaeon]